MGNKTMCTAPLRLYHLTTPNPRPIHFFCPTMLHCTSSVPAGQLESPSLNSEQSYDQTLDSVHGTSYLHHSFLTWQCMQCAHQLLQHRARQHAHSPESSQSLSGGNHSLHLLLAVQVVGGSHAGNVHIGGRHLLRASAAAGKGGGRRDGEEGRNQRKDAGSRPT